MLQVKEMARDPKLVEFWSKLHTKKHDGITSDSGVNN